MLSQSDYRIIDRYHPHLFLQIFIVLNQWNRIGTLEYLIKLHDVQNIIFTHHSREC